MHSVAALFLALPAILVIFGLERPAAGQGNAESASFCFNTWEPYAFKAEKGHKGISVDVVGEAARRAGISAVFRELPWNRCIALVSRGDLDAVIDAAKRDNFLQGPNSYSEYTNTIWVRNADAHKSFTPNAVKGRRVGLVGGYNYPAPLIKIFRDAKSRTEISLDDLINLRKLAFGRVDAVVADRTNGLYLARKHSFALRPLAPAHSSDRLYVSFNMDRAKLHEAVDRAIGDMLKDGTIAKIYTDYIGAAGAMPAR
jgi:polar amino acid transport system substrate-binding protein